MIKKFFKGLIILFLSLAVFLIIWMNLPLKGAKVSNLVTQENDIICYFNLPHNVQKAFEFAHNLRFGNEFLVKPNFSNWLAIRSIKLFSPIKVFLIADFETKEDVAYCILIKGKKIIRLHQLFSGYLKKFILDENIEATFEGIDIYAKKDIKNYDDINAYTVHGDCIILSNDPSKLKKTIEALEVSDVSHKTKEDPEVSLTYFENYAKNCIFFIHNEKAQMTKVVRMLEKESFYSFFPNIEHIKFINGHIDFKKSNYLSGSFYFLFNNLESVPAGMKDIDFFISVINRFFIANKVNFKTVYIDEDCGLRLNYEIKKEERK